MLIIDNYSLLFLLKMSNFDDDDFVLPSKISNNSDNSRENSEENNEEYQGDPKLNPILKCEKNTFSF